MFKVFHFQSQITPPQEKKSKYALQNKYYLWCYKYCVVLSTLTPGKDFLSKRSLENVPFYGFPFLVYIATYERK